MSISVTLELRQNRGLSTAVPKAGNSGTFTVTQTSEKYAAAVQAIGTSMEAITLGDVTTPGFSWFRNLDATNYVEIGINVAGFQPVLKLKPGEGQVFRFATAAPQARANTASVDLEYIILAD